MERNQPSVLQRWIDILPGGMLDVQYFQPSKEWTEASIEVTIFFYLRNGRRSLSPSDFANCQQSREYLVFHPGRSWTPFRPQWRFNTQYIGGKLGFQLCYYLYNGMRELFTCLISRS
nr:hypothetical protein [Candidatus Sigynarchaeota archaeon]